MVVGGRCKSIAFFIALGAGLIAFILLLYVGWVLLGWRHGILLFFGILLTLVLIAGVVLNTTFLVGTGEIGEMRNTTRSSTPSRKELEDARVASIRLYLETLLSRPVEEERREEFYRTMLEDSDRLLGTIEQILRTGHIGHARRHLHLSTVDFGALVEECLTRARRLYHLSASAMTFRQTAPTIIRCDAEEVRAAVSNLIDNAINIRGGKRAAGRARNDAGVDDRNVKSVESV